MAGGVVYKQGCGSIDALEGQLLPRQHLRVLAEPLTGVSQECVSERGNRDAAAAKPKEISSLQFR